MIERNRRVRFESRARSTASTLHGPINARWVYERARNALNAAQSWVVISIAGCVIPLVDFVDASHQTRPQVSSLASMQLSYPSLRSGCPT